MARTEGRCQCSVEGCECNGTTVTGWVDKLTGVCRKCEIGHGDRWGHRDTKAETTNN